jgi:ribonuclease HI
LVELPAVLIHADESCLGNQFQARANPGGAAGLLETWARGGWERKDYWVSERDTTNNRMALRSAIEPLRALTRPCRVIFVSDSQYLIRGMNEWIKIWKKQGWKRKTGAIENLELWQQLVEEAPRHQVNWEWVRGHAGHPKNEYANHLATRAAKQLDASNGLVSSGFLEWLSEQREKRGRYLDYRESLPPEEIGGGAGRGAAR